MKSIHTTIDIDAPAARVWDVLTDLDDYPAWNPFMPVAEGVVQEGARLKVYIKPPGGTAMTFKPTVQRAETNRAFSWLGRLFISGLFDGEHIFELEALDANRTRLVHRERFKGLLVPLLWNSLEGPTRAGFEAMNTALKARAEGLVHS